MVYNYTYLLFSLFPPCRSGTFPLSRFRSNNLSLDVLIDYHHPTMPVNLANMDKQVVLSRVGNP